MIRYFTLLCAVSAGLSGLFLYSKKHQTTVLDQQISSIVSDTQHIRQQTAMLRTEWALLNQPDRLSRLAARFEPSLQPMTPRQFVRLSDLAGHLPAPGSVHAPNPRDAISPGVIETHGEALALADAKAPVAQSTETKTSEPKALAKVEAPAHTDVAQATAPHAATQVAAAQPPAAPRAPRPATMLASVERPAVASTQAVQSRNTTTLALDTVPTVRHAAKKPATDALDSALGGPDAQGERRTAHTVLASATAPRHVAAPEAAHVAAPRPAVQLAAYHPAHPAQAQTATWRPVAAQAAPRYIEARASYNGSLLGHSALGGGLPPPVPVAN
ncbi:hypothetical protein [Acetobacter sp. DsW_063]|uniref:cell division protein FtsL n=1 Tax=Acetobacter sp. DsW_063 TaxID=1514894 RepID=UPI000A369478|nr:hypothetical protein [Acetobacter sp. DsW_063]OUJ16816.1 hypothetical protein HK28_09780 [Acetobacter sp. DsW_063]